MDIKSLLSPSILSPQEPSRETSTAPPIRPSPKKQRRSKSSRLVNSDILNTTSSPLLNNATSPSTLLHNAVSQAQVSMPSPPLKSPASALRMTSAGTPPVDNARSSRQPSTPGMDTLADLASMQHHQQIARATAGGLRSAEIYDSQLSPSTVLPNLHAIPRTQSTARPSLERNMTDKSTRASPPRTFAATSLSETDLQTIAQLVGYLAENPYAYESHVQLVKLLHQGLLSHISSSSSSATQADPQAYDLLRDLRDAREAMDTRFALGEDLWVEWVEDQKLLAQTPEDMMSVIESCKKAVDEENGSVKLWVLYADWMLSLYKIAHSPGQSNDNGSGMVEEAQRWSEEDKFVAREVYGWQQVMDVWKEGVQATGWRINDSHLLWDRYTELLMQELEISPSIEGVANMKLHFEDRLQKPHATWDQSFQAFSNFISRYNNSTYEDTMVFTNRRGAKVKEKYDWRETLELKLSRATESNDKDAEWAAYTEYIDWELAQSRKKNAFNFDLVNAMYQRATLRFPSYTSLWEDYVTFLNDEIYIRGGLNISPLPVLERASRHCPWSGTLWSQYLLAAEKDRRPFTEIEDIKHKATSTGLLDAGGMEEMLKVHTAWCGFLRRRAFENDSTDEDLDVAEVGIRSAIEDMETLGRQKYGEEYKGDPQSRLERIYIKYLSQSGNWQSARDVWKGLASRRGDSYEFWLRFYGWEMFAWGKLALIENNVNERRNLKPSEATEVLRQAMRRPELDWPDKIIDSFLHHCEDHEDVEELSRAVTQAYKARKVLAKRRENEALEALQAAQDQQQQSKLQEAELEGIVPSGKRKREQEYDDPEGSASKKNRPNVSNELDPLVEEQSSSHPKRDRENATIIVKNLSIQVKDSRIRQYFKDCGTINSLKLLPDENRESATATIEFDSKEDVLAAQTKDMKTLDGRAIEVQVGTGSTLFVANFPPTADEAYIRGKFSEFGEVVDVRFPSLKFDTHRRFCYIQFKSSSEAQAATALNNELQGGKLKLVVQLSDPEKKQDRTGAMYDGRELYLSNLDWNATNEEISTIFSKYGKVEKVRIPTNVGGKSKGIGFVVFSTKEAATAALDMNLTKFKSRLLNVSLSTNNPAKRQATTIITSTSRSTISPSPEDQSMNGDIDNVASPTPPPTVEHRPSASEIQSRTLALLNVPDTVNDARIRAIVEVYGPLTKVVLRPDHQGAIIEFRDVASTGRAALGVDGYEITPGRKLGVGSVGEMLHQKAEKKSDRIGGSTIQKEKDGGINLLQVNPSIRRPTQTGARRGGKGGLGMKKGGVIRNRARDSRQEDDKQDELTEDSTKQNGKLRNNSDFKAMFLKE